MVKQELKERSFHEVTGNHINFCNASQSPRIPIKKSLFTFAVNLVVFFTALQYFPYHNSNCRYSESYSTIERCVFEEWA